VARARSDREEEGLFVISVAAKLVDCHPQTLRMYERLGLIQPQRTAANLRLYSQSDIEKVRRIQHLTQDLGVNLAGVDVVFGLLDRMEELRKDMRERLERVLDEAERMVGHSIDLHTLLGDLPDEETP
jgi:MerR family transcriptional regulator/heat shock protein HspR